MKIKTPRDRRNEIWPVMEKEIQSGSKKKDKTFVLSGSWKKFVREQDGFKIYRVNGSWVRHNLSFYFGHGGHGFVHEFIPVDEIWVSSHHPYEGRGATVNCSCKLKRKGQKISQNYFDSTVIHEITECNQMKKGRIYWVAHNIALAKEKESGILENPYGDI